LRRSGADLIKAQGLLNMAPLEDAGYISANQLLHHLTPVASGKASIYVPDSMNDL